MKNTQNIALVLLSVTAAILAGLLIGSLSDNSAQAAHVSVSKGDYVMFSYTWSDTQDLLCVIDSSARKMNIYARNNTAKTLDLIDKVDLEMLFSRD